MSIESRSRQYGTVFDHWRIKEFLGSGSGGKTAVFRLVRSDSARGASALKVVNLIEARGDLNNLSDFRRKEYEAAREACSKNAEQEVWLMDDLRGHTNIVDYLDHTFVDWSDETSFGRDLLIRMELLEDLRSDLQDGRLFSEQEILKIGRDLCTALIRCHRKNILHRDVKPENIFRNKDGDYKLGDFGVSRVLDACPGAVASTGIGTYEYWPAEQMTGRYDKRVDIYSLGLVLYELSNQNRLPFAASTYVTGKEVSLRLSGTPLPEPSGASAALNQVILKACAFKPEERYQSAEELLRALNRVLRIMQERESKYSNYATEAAGFQKAVTTANNYITTPVNAARQSSKSTFSTEPTERYTPRYATQVFAHRRKNAIPKVWIITFAILCISVFGVGCLVADIVGKRSSDGKDTVLQSETSEETTNDAIVVPTTTESMEVDSTESEPIATQVSIAETTSPAIETIDPIYMQAVRVITGSKTNYYGTPLQNVTEYDENGYPIHSITIDNSSAKTYSNETYHIYNDMALLDEVLAMSGEASLLSDRERRTRKNSLYSLLVNKVSYAGDAFPKFRLVYTDENGYVVRFVWITHSDIEDDPIHITDNYITFDDNMNKVKQITYRDGSQSGFDECEYNENNQLIRRVSSSMDTPQYIYEYSYDSKGRRIKETVTCLFNDKYSFYSVYTYDEEGNSYTEDCHQNDGTVRVTVNQLDEYGGVVDSIQYVNGKKDYERHTVFESIFVPSNQVESLSNTYDGIGVSYYIVEQNG